MTTHHGRPGGRGLELLLLMAVILLTLAVFVMGIALAVFGQAYFALKVIRIEPALLAPLNVAAFAYWHKPIGRFIWWLCAKIWTPFLRYYKYEQATLNPIIDGEQDDRPDH